MTYGEEYFTSNNYENYLGRQLRYEKIAEELQQTLCNLKLNVYPYLDYGCAVGHLVRGLIKSGVPKREVFGYDISDWAINYGIRKEPQLCLSNQYNPLRSWGVTFFLDVLEHMQEQEIRELIQTLKTDCFVFRIPVCEKSGEDYVEESSRKDKTHVIRWTKSEWKELFCSFKYNVIHLNLKTVYDSKGVFCGIAIKDKPRNML